MFYFFSFKGFLFESNNSNYFNKESSEPALKQQINTLVHRTHSERALNSNDNFNRLTQTNSSSSSSSSSSTSFALSSPLYHSSSSNYAILIVLSALVSIILLALFLLIMVYFCFKRKANIFKSNSSTSTSNTYNDLAASHFQHPPNHIHTHHSNASSNLSNSILVENYNSLGFTASINSTPHKNQAIISPPTQTASTTVPSLVIASSAGVGAGERVSPFLTSSSSSSFAASSTATSTANFSTLTPLKEICISLPLAKPHLSELRPQLSVESKMKTKTLIER